MDKRYTAPTLQQQMDLRRQAVDDVLSHPEWSLPQAIRHLKKTMRLTTTELAKLSGVAFRTLQDIEQERSEGSVQTMSRIFAVLGLKLGVVRVAQHQSPGD
jgi:DNA-binding XRE family transcriptional regulator